MRFTRKTGMQDDEASSDVDPEQGQPESVPSGKSAKSHVDPRRDSVTAGKHAKSRPQQRKGPKRGYLDGQMLIAMPSMGANIDHAAGEAVIAHGRHRDQHLSVEIAALGPLALLRPGLGGLARSHEVSPQRVGTDAGFGGRAGRHRLRLLLRIDARRRLVVLHACLASEPHVEMLPDWGPIANDARPGQESMHASCHD